MNVPRCFGITNCESWPLCVGLWDDTEHRAQERNRGVTRVLGIGATSQDSVRLHSSLPSVFVAAS